MDSNRDRKGRSMGKKRKSMGKRYGYKKRALIMAVSMAVLTMAACGNISDFYEETKEQQKNDLEVNAAAVSLVTREDMFTDRDLGGEEKEGVRIVLSDNSVQCDSQAVTVEDGKIWIVEEGTYYLTGTLREGMIVVAAGDMDKVQLVLDNVLISNRENAAIYVSSADKVFITLAEGSVNMLENEGGYRVLDDNKIDGVIFAKSNLTINGRGSLEIKAAEGHGIVSKDDLKITDGNLTVSAHGHGLSGKDSVRVAGGTCAITSGKDGIHSEHDTNTEKGYVYIGGGEITITAHGDGISAGNFLQIDGGNFVIAAGGGSAEKTLARDETGGEVSAKGIKASGDLVVNGGKFIIDSQDDALHSNVNLTIYGGEFQIATGDDGFHADDTVMVAGGSIEITDSYEGIEGNHVVISGGKIRLYATDDGLNAAGGNDQSGNKGPFGRESFAEANDSTLVISGGIINIRADGDGIDSNGTLTVTGGEVYISGPENHANGALDYDGVGQITGGIVVAVGSSGMAMNFGETSTQGSILIQTDKQNAGTEVMVKNVQGEVLVSYTAENDFDSIVVSSPDLKQGETYIISAGETEHSVTLDNLIYGKGMGGFGPGPGNGWGGKEGEP